MGILFPKLCHMWAEHQLSGSYHNTRQHAGEDLMYNLMVKKRGSHFNDIFARYFICPGETGYWNVNFLIKTPQGPGTLPGLFDKCLDSEEYASF